jgi:excisionase family DNA binding protein
VLAAARWGSSQIYRLKRLRIQWKNEQKFTGNYRKFLELAVKTELNTNLPALAPEPWGSIPTFMPEAHMRNAAARSNLLVPEVREVMDIRQASDYLGISPDTLYKYASEGFVPAFKLGNRWRFKRSRLDEWMDRQSDMHATPEEINPEEKKPVKAAL